LGGLLLSLLLAACPRSDEPKLLVGVDEAIASTGFAAYLQTAFEAHTKQPTELIVGTAQDIADRAAAGTIDVALLTSEEQVQRLRDANVVAVAAPFAHEELVFIGPIEDQFRSHGSTDPVEFIKNVSRANYLYLKARAGSTEAERHRALFLATKDRVEAGSFMETELSGLPFALEVIDKKAFGLLRRSAILMAAEQGKTPHRVYQDGHEGLVLALWSVAVHPARTKRAGDRGLHAWRGGADGAKLVEKFGAQRFGLPIYAAGVPREGEGAKVPGVSGSK